MGAKAPFEARGQRERRAQSASVFFGPIPFGPYLRSLKGGTGFVNKKESAFLAPFFLKRPDKDKTPLPFLSLFPLYSEYSGIKIRRKGQGSCFISWGSAQSFYPAEGLSAPACQLCNN